MSEPAITPWDLQNAIANGVKEAIERATPFRPYHGTVEPRAALMAQVAGTIAAALVADRIHHLLADPSLESVREARSVVVECALEMAQSILSKVNA